MLRKFSFTVSGGNLNIGTGCENCATRDSFAVVIDDVILLTTTTDGHAFSYTTSTELDDTKKHIMKIYQIEGGNSHEGAQISITDNIGNNVLSDVLGIFGQNNMIKLVGTYVLDLPVFYYPQDQPAVELVVATLKASDSISNRTGNLDGFRLYVDGIEILSMPKDSQGFNLSKDILLDPLKTHWLSISAIYVGATYGIPGSFSIGNISGSLAELYYYGAKPFTITKPAPSTPSPTPTPGQISGQGISTEKALVIVGGIASAIGIAAVAIFKAK